MNRARLNSFLMFVWLVVGYGVIHATVVGWFGAIVTSLWQPTQTYEQFQARSDGELYIQESGARVTFRRLDGTAINDTSGLNANIIYPTNFVESQNEPPVQWQARIASFFDFQREKTAWYLVVPPDESNRCYFIGYEKFSRRQLGYIGLNGFSSSIPTQDQSFLIKTNSYDAFGGCVVSTFSGSSHSATQIGEWVELNYVPKVNSPADAVWILSQGNVYEIRLGARTVQKRFENRTDFRSISSMESMRDGKKYFHLLVRTETSLMIVDPQTNDVKKVNVGPIEPKVGEMVYGFDSGQILFCRHRWHQDLSGEMSDKRKLVWVDANGQIEKEMDLELNKRRVTGGSELLLAGFVSPVPVLPIAATTIGPLFVSQQDDDLPNTYGGRFLYVLRITWFWILSSTLIGIAACWACRRRERDVFGSTSWFWPILMLPCGFFGWVAYVFLKPLPPRLPNRQWRTAVPEPVLPLGTEIYA